MSPPRVFRMAGTRRLVWLACTLLLMVSHAWADDVTVTVKMNQPVMVTGTPRIPVDVGGLTRYANYRSGGGTATLTFVYVPQLGDFDADGVTPAPTIQLNGGSLRSSAGRPIADLSYTLLAIQNARVQTYQAAFNGPITSANASAVSFTMRGLPAGSSFLYVIASSAGTTISGTGVAVSPISQTISGLDLSAFPAGSLTLSVTVTGPSGTGLPASAMTLPIFTNLPLDSLPQAAAAYSVRQLRSAYTGPLLRVRRSSDLVEKEIGATLGGQLDTQALRSFCGSSSCLVTVWYDQAGNGRNAVQSAAAAQPRIVWNGTLIGMNGRPALQGDGAGVQMSFPLGPLANYPASINLVVARSAAAERGAWVKLGGTAQPSAGIAIGVGGPQAFTTAGNVIVALKELLAWMPSSAVLAAANVITFTQGAGTNSTSLFQNGDAIPVQNATPAPRTPLGTQGYLFGHSYLQNGATQQRWSTSPISEVILFAFLLSASTRSTLERSQGAYFGIALP